MKIATIIGARPQFIKASAVSQAIQKYNSDVSLRGAKPPVSLRDAKLPVSLRGAPKGRRSNLVSDPLTETIIHTGQHYDYRMSKVFFEQLDIPEPHYNLEVGSGTHAQQTGAMLIKIEEVLQKVKPDLVLVYGDTNSTLAGALAAAKLNIAVGHVEAGMRSFNREMPEEINRVLTDHVASLHFCSTHTAVDNLKKEGITKGIHLVGDVMYDVALKSIAIAEKKSKILAGYGLKAKSYYLATVHRQSNTDNLDNLKNILDAFTQLDRPVVFPVHPRTRKAINLLNAIRYPLSANTVLIEPVSYLDMLILEKNAQKILTDSGGVQKEAYFYKVPCVTLRNETEWVETVDAGWNILTGTVTKKIVAAAKKLPPRSQGRRIFGDGKASEKIVKILISL